MLEQSSFFHALDEVWRPIVGDEGRYEVSNLGRVRSLRFRNGERDVLRAEPLVLRLNNQPTGYLSAQLANRRRRLVHRLVLETFVGLPPAGHQCAHENGVRTDNRLVNLAWKTPSENHLDKERHGTMARGERNGAHTKPDRVLRGEHNGLAKLTAEHVLAIRAAVRHGETCTAVAVRYGVSRSAISRVVCRRNWRHLP